MSTLFILLQPTLICYIFLISVFRSKGKLRMMLLGADIGLLLVLLLVYFIVAKLLALSFLPSSFVVFVFTVAYLAGLVYVTQKHYVARVSNKKVRKKSSRVVEDDFDSDDFDSDDSFNRELGAKYKNTSYKIENSFDEDDDDDFPEFGKSFKKAETVKKSKLDEPVKKPEADKTAKDSLFDDDFGLGGSFGSLSKDTALADKPLEHKTSKDSYATSPIKDKSKDDDILSDFLFDFGGDGGTKGTEDISGNSNNSEKTAENSFSDNTSDLDDFSGIFNNTTNDSPFEKFLGDSTDTEEPTNYFSNLDMFKETNDEVIPFANFNLDAKNDELQQADLSLDELLGNYSLLKGTLAKVDNKFMSTDMDLEYVLLENINAQNIRVKTIDNNTIYINKFASEIALANAQRLLIENNIPDAKKLLAQLCCSSTDSAISNEAYICFKEIVFGKDSEMEADDLINSMIDKEERLVELVKGITSAHN